MRSPSASPLVAGRGLGLSRHGRVILDNVDLAVEPGEIVTLIGPNGAGKSTLVRLLLGLTRPERGSVARRPGVRIGYAPQHLRIDPVLPVTVGRFLTLGAAAPAGRVVALLARVGLDDIRDRQMAALSGGEQSRVLLARALLREPDLLVLDEPVAGVDVNGQAELYALIGAERERTGAGVLMVSHDLHLVMARTDRVVCIEGHVCCEGHPVEVARDPSFVRLFGPRLAELVALYRHDLAHHAHHHAHGHPHHPPGTPP